MTGIEAKIPPRGETAEDGLGMEPHPIERTISWLKQFRRVGVRRESLARIYAAMVTLASSLILYRQLASS